MNEQRLLTVDEVAIRIRQSPRSVRDKISRGELPAIKIGVGPRAPIRIDADEFERWLFAATAPARAAPPGGLEETA